MIVMYYIHTCPNANLCFACYLMDRVFFVTRETESIQIQGRARQLGCLLGNDRIPRPKQHLIRVSCAGSTCKDISTFGIPAWFCIDSASKCLITDPLILMQCRRIHPILASVLSVLYSCNW